MKAGTFITSAILRTVVLGMVCGATLAAEAADSSKASRQQQVRDLAESTLQQLYKAKPAAKAKIEEAAGYAVFNNMGVKILLAGSGQAKGSPSITRRSMKPS